jgi:hypothetical protein
VEILLENDLDKQTLLKDHVCLRDPPKARTSHMWRRTSVTRLLYNLEWDSIQLRHMLLSLKAFYMVYYGIWRIDGGGAIAHPVYVSQRVDNTRKVNPLYSRIDRHKYSFFPKMIKTWNLLPDSIVTAVTIEEFEKKLIVWLRNHPNDLL